MPFSGRETYMSPWTDHLLSLFPCPFKVEIKSSAKAFRRNRAGHNQQGNGEWLGMCALESNHLGYIQHSHLDVHLLFSKHARPRHFSSTLRISARWELTVVLSSGYFFNSSHLKIRRLSHREVIICSTHTRSQNCEQVCWHLYSLVPPEKWRYKLWYLPHRDVMRLRWNNLHNALSKGSRA